MGSAVLRCSFCFQKTHKFVVVTKDKRGVCLKCSRKEYVKHRPKGMNWREAFNNIIKHGTFEPKEKNDTMFTPSNQCQES